MSADSKATKDEIQRNRNEAYQGGWGDGYAEGFGKGTDLSQASVAAALEAAAGIAVKAADRAHKMSKQADEAGHDTTACIEGCVGDEAATIASEIRSLITPDQHDALSAHVAAEVVKARADDAAKIAQIADAYDEGGDRAIATGIRTVLACVYQIGAKP